MFSSLTYNNVMVNPVQKISKKHITGAVRSFVFHLVLFLYLWLVIDTRLIYHGGGWIQDFPNFYLGWTFFRETVLHPGGMIGYISAFLSQFFSIGWAGAIIITIQSWLLCISTGSIVDRMNFPRLQCIRFIPPILILIAYTQYTFFFPTMTALLAVLACVCLFLKIAPTNKGFSCFVFLILSVLCYTITAGAYLFFAVLCVIYEILFRRRLRIPLVYLLIAAGIPYIGGVLIFKMSVVDAFIRLLPFHWEIIDFQIRENLIKTVYVLYLYLPVILIIYGSWRILIKRSDASTKAPDITKPIFRWIIGTSFLFLIAGSAVFFSYDNRLRTQLKIDYYAYHKNWPKVLEVAKSDPDNYFVIFTANRALYHTGRLLSEMFLFPQHPKAFFLSTQKNTFVFWRKFDIYIDLGLMNMADHMLTESLEIFGERPAILKRLALVNMVKGDINTATVYLKKLTRTIFDADWANAYIEKLRSDPGLGKDNWIQQMRALKLTRDFDCAEASIDDTLLALLESNPKNQMAVEYLLSMYLQAKMVNKVAENIGRLNDIGYVTIPSYCEEAILIRNSIKSTKTKLQNYRISPRSVKKFGDFNRILNRYKRDKKAAFDDLKEFGDDNYFFYYLYTVPKE